MATRIRMTRHGSKKRPFYRIVAASTGAPRDGRFIEQLGHYDPTKTPVDVKLDLARLSDWIAKGAQPSDTVLRLLKKAGWKRGQVAAGAAAGQG